MVFDLVMVMLFVLVGFFLLIVCFCLMLVFVLDFLFFVVDVICGIGFGLLNFLCGIMLLIFLNFGSLKVCISLKMVCFLFLVLIMRFIFGGQGGSVMICGLCLCLFCGVMVFGYGLLQCIFCVIFLCCQVILICFMIFGCEMFSVFFWYFEGLKMMLWWW